MAVASLLRGECHWPLYPADQTLADISIEMEVPGQHWNLVRRGSNEHVAQSLALPACSTCDMNPLS